MRWFRRPVRLNDSSNYAIYDVPNPKGEGATGAWRYYVELQPHTNFYLWSVKKQKQDLHSGINLDEQERLKIEEVFDQGIREWEKVSEGL